MASRKRSKSKPAKAPEAAPQPFDAEVRRLERLLSLMQEHGLTELELADAGRSVRMSKGGPATYAMPLGSPAMAGGGGVAPASPAAPKVDKSAGEPFLSPMVGTFYRAPSPEAKAFVMEGDTIAADATLCIIEAMKVMNEIKAERAGKIVQILVENGEAVEYGQPLFLIKR